MWTGIDDSMPSPEFRLLDSRLNVPMHDLCFSSPVTSPQTGSATEAGRHCSPLRASLVVTHRVSRRRPPIASGPMSYYCLFSRSLFRRKRIPLPLSASAIGCCLFRRSLRPLSPKKVTRPVPGTRTLPSRPPHSRRNGPIGPAGSLLETRDEEGAQEEVKNPTTDAQEGRTWRIANTNSHPKDSPLIVMMLTVMMLSCSTPQVHSQLCQVCPCSDLPPRHHTASRLRTI